MAEYKASSGWKEKLFVGVEIPLPWLASIVAALLFNAGIMYSQFTSLKDEVLKISGRTETIQLRVDSIERQELRRDDRMTMHENRVTDHEIRLRELESKKR